MDSHLQIAGYQSPRPMYYRGPGSIEYASPGLVHNRTPGLMDYGHAWNIKSHAPHYMSTHPLSSMDYGNPGFADHSGLGSMNYDYPVLMRSSAPGALNYYDHTMSPHTPDGRRENINRLTYGMGIELSPSTHRMEDFRSVGNNSGRQGPSQRYESKNRSSFGRDSWQPEDIKEGQRNSMDPLGVSRSQFDPGPSPSSRFDLRMPPRFGTLQSNHAPSPPFHSITPGRIELDHDPSPQVHTRMPHRLERQASHAQSPSFHSNIPSRPQLSHTQSPLANLDMHPRFETPENHTSFRRLQSRHATSPILMPGLGTTKNQSKSLLVNATVRRYASSALDDGLSPRISSPKTPRFRKATIGHAPLPDIDFGDNQTSRVIRPSYQPLVLGMGAMAPGAPSSAVCPPMAAHGPGWNPTLETSEYSWDVGRRDGDYLRPGGLAPRNNPPKKLVKKRFDSLNPDASDVSSGAESENIDEEIIGLKILRYRHPKADVNVDRARPGKGCRNEFLDCQKVIDFEESFNGLKSLPVQRWEPHVYKDAEELDRLHNDINLFTNEDALKAKVLSLMLGEKRKRVHFEDGDSDEDGQNGIKGSDKNGGSGPPKKLQRATVTRPHHPVRPYTRRLDPTTGKKIPKKAPAPKPLNEDGTPAVRNSVVLKSRKKKKPDAKRRKSKVRKKSITKERFTKGNSEDSDFGEEEGEN